MAQIRITKKYVDPKYPNLPFEAGEVYDAILPIGGAYTSATVERVVSSASKNTESANLVRISVPKAHWEMFSLTFLQTPNTDPTQSTSAQAAKSDKSTKYIILGIAVIGFISYLAMKTNKK